MLWGYEHLKFLAKNGLFSSKIISHFFNNSNCNLLMNERIFFTDFLQIFPRFSRIFKLSVSYFKLHFWNMIYFCYSFFIFPPFSVFSWLFQIIMFFNILSCYLFCIIFICPNCFWFFFRIFQIFGHFFIYFPFYVFFLFFSVYIISFLFLLMDFFIVFV